MPTADTIRDIILGRLLGSPAIRDGDTAKGGFLWQLANAFARQGRNLLVRALALQDQCLPTRATGDPLVWWSDAALGEGAAAATAWVGTIEIRCVNNTQTVPATQSGTAEDGTVYRTTAAINPTDWVSAGTYYYSRPASTATTLGTVGNKATNTPITLSAPPVGVYDVAYLASTTTEGDDAETETALQARIGQHLRDMPGGGSCANFRAWCQEVPGVYDAFIYPRWEGVGALGLNTVRCVIVGPPGGRILTAAEVAATDTYLDDREPLFCDSTVSLPQTVSQRVAITIRCAPGYGPDYDDSIYNPSVTAFNAGTRRIDLSINPVGNLVAGNRIVIHCADDRSYQMVVQSVAVGYVIVEDVWVSNPTLTLVRAGGPLWAAVRAAVEAAFDNLGTSVSSTANKVRWPLTGSEMPSTLYRSDIYQQVEAITGLVSSTVTVPNTDVTNTAAETTVPSLIRLAGGGGNPDVTVTWAVAA